MITLSVGIGLIASFIFAELTGLSVGLIVPGYLALYLDQPPRVVVTLVIALATYAVVRILANVVIIYGRRRFMAMVLIGFWLGWLFAKLMVGIPSAGPELKAIGYVIPGLIANESARQGVLRTFAAVLVVAAIVRIVLMLVR